MTKVNAWQRWTGAHKADKGEQQQQKQQQEQLVVGRQPKPNENNKKAMTTTTMTMTCTLIGNPKSSREWRKAIEKQREKRGKAMQDTCWLRSQIENHARPLTGHAPSLVNSGGQQEDIARLQAQEREKEREESNEKKKTLNICVIFISSTWSSTSISAWTTFDAIKFGIFELS